MRRRSFLLLRKEREVELSCRTLYMRCLDAAAAAGPAAVPGSSPTRPLTASTLAAAEYEQSWQFEEPPAAFHSPTQRELFDRLEDELLEVEVVHLTDIEWLRDEFRPDIERVLASFRARGGRVAQPA